MKAFVETYSLVDIKKGVKLAKCLQANFYYSGLAEEAWLHSSSLLEYMVKYVILVISPIKSIHLQFRIYRFFFWKVLGVLQSVVAGMQYSHVMTLKF